MLLMAGDGMTDALSRAYSDDIKRFYFLCGYLFFCEISNFAY